MVKGKCGSFRREKIGVVPCTEYSNALVWEREFPQYCDCLEQGVEEPQLAKNLDEILVDHLLQEEADRIDIFFDVIRFEKEKPIPSTAVHCDYTDVSAARILAMAYAEEEANICGGMSAGTINQLWLPTGHNCLQFRLVMMPDGAQKNICDFGEMMQIPGGGGLVVTHQSGEEQKSEDG